MIKEIKLKIMLRTNLVPMNYAKSLGAEISITSEKNVSYIRNKFPKMFQVALLGCSNNDCDIEEKNSISNVTMINEDFNLWKMYGKTLHDEDDASLKELDDISNNVKRNLTVTEIDLIAKTIENVLVEQYHLVNDEVLSKSNKSLIDSRRDMLMNMLCKFLSPRRKDIVGDLRFFQLLEDVLFLDVENLDSKSIYLNFSKLVFQKYECSYSSFNYACARVNSSNLSEVYFEGEFYQMNFTTRFDRRFRTLIPSFSPNLFQLCLIEMASTIWLGSDLKKNLLENKALSLR